MPPEARSQLPPLLKRLRPAWLAGGAVLLALIYAVLQVGFVRPYLWPAGHGALFASPQTAISNASLPRLPDIAGSQNNRTAVRAVFPATPAERIGLRPGDELVVMRNRASGIELDLAALPRADSIARLHAWREAYRFGVRGTVSLTVVRNGEAGRQIVRFAPVEQSAAWEVPRTVFSSWARRHLGPILQIVVFTGAALVLLAMRGNDATAALVILGLTLSAVGGGGSLLGSEVLLPAGLRETLTVFTWIAGPLAFPAIALAILYFPRQSPLLHRHPWLHVVPFVVAMPMIGPGVLTALFLAGVDSAAAAAAWDAGHAEVYYGSFAASIVLNVLVIAEGIFRYRANRDANERRRIRIVVLTAVPGVLAYAVKAGVPAVRVLAGSPPLLFPTSVEALLQALVLLPAFGLVYAITVHRVLGPRMVLRRSLQYALARNTLTLAAALPGAALVLSLVRQRNAALAEIVSGAPAFYGVLLAGTIAVLRYRERARAWLDRRFFRQEYDARAILIALANRVRFETDPGDLTALVVGQIDQALHPKLTAVLVTGIDQSRLVPVDVLHGSAESLPLAGGLVTMLRWSDEPLEIVLQDPRSPARRLPPEEQEWLECTGTVLMVPVTGEEGTLIGVIALGEKRSEEPYTAEDRQLLSSLASQMGLGIDVARLRRRMLESTESVPARSDTTRIEQPADGLAVCPRCGRCDDARIRQCPEDSSPMELTRLPRIIDAKYRIDQVVGRGGMGAIYRAWDLRLNRDVALKAVRPDLLGDADAHGRFQREAQVVARLQHPAIVSIFDYGTLAAGGAYLVMEFIRGEDLRRALQREGRFVPERTVRILGTVCDAMEAAHRAGILHRDLKPENILLGDRETIKILDFGIAKLVTQAQGFDGVTPTELLTIEGTVIGTPAYMAPEQLRGEPVDGRADVFSLGVIAYELLTGELPFGPGPPADIILRQAQGVRVMNRPDQPVAVALERAVTSALRMNPAERPASPAVFAGLLQTALGLTR